MKTGLGRKAVYTDWVVKCVQNAMLLLLTSDINKNLPLKRTEHLTNDRSITNLYSKSQRSRILIAIIHRGKRRKKLYEKAELYLGRNRHS